MDIFLSKTIKNELNNIEKNSEDENNFLIQNQKNIQGVEIIYLKNYENKENLDLLKMIYNEQQLNESHNFDLENSNSSIQIISD